MSFLFEIFPVVLFFLFFKFYDIYAATMVGIASSFLQVIIYRLVKKRWDNKQLITLAVFVVFGGMTLYFHNPIFVKWKPTIIFWIFALIILGCQLFTSKPLMQRLLQGVTQGHDSVPAHVWRTLNILWFAFFIVLGAINLYIAYHYSDSAWVNFKFYGITSALFVLSIFQALYLMRYIEIKEEPGMKK